MLKQINAKIAEVSCKCIQPRRTRRTRNRL